MARLVAGIAVIVAAVGLVACGESAQEKATAQVCKARTDISTQIKKLEGLTLSTSVVTEAKTSVEAIRGDLEKIKDAQPDLAAPRKEQVEAATDKFTQTLTSLASDVGKLALSSGGSGAGLSAAETGLKSALSQLWQLLQGSARSDQLFVARVLAATLRRCAPASRGACPHACSRLPAWR